MGIDWPDRQEWSRILLEATILLVLGVLLGLTVNYRVTMDVLSGQDAQSASHQGRDDAEGDAPLPVPAALDEVRDLLAGGALAVDARSREAYRLDRLPGARSLPLGDFEDRREEFFEKVPRDRTLVVYCSGDGCPDSFDLSVLLMQAGYTDVRLFEGGLPEWRAASLPVEGDGA